MDTITVIKTDLLDTLTRNREEHRTMFLAAQDRYRDQMVEELDRALRDAREGRKIKRAFALPVPEDYTSTFDTVIEMLAWDQNDTVELTQQDFQRYVQNKWEWERSFASNTGSYLAQ